MSNLIRTNSICPTPEEQLIHLILSNKSDEIETHINQNPHLLLDSTISNLNKSFLSEACACEQISKETIKSLVKLGPNQLPYKNYEAFWEALKNPSVAPLAALLESKQVNIDTLLRHNQTPPLHFLIQHIYDGEYYESLNRSDFLGHVKLLAENLSETSINRTNSKGLSALALAVKYEYKEIVQEIIQSSKHKLDLSAEINGKTIRQLIEEKGMCDLSLYEEYKGDKTLDIKDKLFKILKLSNAEVNFINLYNESNYGNGADDDGLKTFLEYACERNFVKIVRFLVDEKGISLDSTKTKLPLEIAIEHNYKDLCEYILIEKKCYGQLTCEIFCDLIRDPQKHRLLNVLLQNEQFLWNNIDLNATDLMGKTPLHYAIKNGLDSLTLKLLANGASLLINTNGEYGFMPIELLDPKLFEKHLNDSISKNSDGEIVFKLDSLMPPTEGKTYEMEMEPLKERQSRRTQEMKFFDFITKNRNYRHFISHPVLVSFLQLKWHKIREIFYANLLFYCFFILSLFSYIFSKYANFEQNISESYQLLANISMCCLILTMIIFILRELFQVIIDPKLYLSNFDNYIEISLLLITLVILIGDDASIDSRRQIAAIAIVFAAFELILMFGQHPHFCTHVVMFKKVSVNFIKLFLWFSMLILAFAWSFNILFGNTNRCAIDTKNNSTCTNNGTSDEDAKFTGAGPSLVKTIVMLTGEFDADSIDFKTFPIVSRLIFLIFVFMITIILLNLVNGLAVSDTQTIKNDAEFVGLVARAQHISYVERMCLGNENYLFNYFKTLMCCFNKNDFNVIKNPFNYKKINLFNNCTKCVIIYDECSGKIKMPELQAKKDVEKGSQCFHCSDLYLDKDTRLRINYILKERHINAENENELKMLNFKIEQIRLALNKINL